MLKSKMASQGIKIGTVFMLLLLFLSCNQGDEVLETYPYTADREREVAMRERMTVSGMAAPKLAFDEGAAAGVTERKVVSTGHLSFRTDDLSETRQFLQQALDGAGAYVESEQEHNYPTRLVRSLTVRVPADNFNELIDAVADHAGHFEEKNINQQDITEQYIDIAARLKNKQALEARYLELLKKANTVEELIDVERELANARAEIESMQGQLEHMDKRVDYSTLTIIYYIPQQATRAIKVNLGYAFQEGWQNLIAFIVWLIKLWPFVLLFVILLAVIIARRRR